MVIDQLTSALQTTLQKTRGVNDVLVTWSRPTDAAHGDLATPIALQVAKKIGAKPVEVAQELLAALQGEPLVEKAEIAGPGYVNVWLTSAGHAQRLQAALASCTPTQTRKEDPVIFDYCGPNIAKPLGVHHLGSHIIGQAIINLYRHTGANVIGWSYPGDWGTQFGKLAVAYARWGDGTSPSEHSVEELLSLYVRFHAEAEQDPALEDEAREAFRKIEQGDKELLAFWKDVVTVTQQSLESLYERLHISIDVVTGESFYQDKMQPILDEGLGKGVFKEGKEGALIVEFPEESGMPPFMVRKSDGSTLYSTRDLAMIRYRLDTYHPAALYYVVDVAQSLHFQQLEATCRQLGWNIPAFEHTLFGRMRFKDASMSTRKGTVLRLEEVLDEAVSRAAEVIRSHGEGIQTDDAANLAEMMGIGAVAYGILSQNRKQDIVFDWEKMLSFDGNSAPYLQYTHARARSVLRKAGLEHASLPEQFSALTQQERDLANTIAQFPGALGAACEQRMPHTLTTYLFTLCQSFNAFYNADPILSAEGAQRDLRLALTFITAQVLRCGAALLTLRVPDRM